MTWYKEVSQGKTQMLHFPPAKEVTGHPNVIDLQMTSPYRESGGMMIKEEIPLSAAELARIEEANKRMLKRPITSLGKKGDTFQQDDKRCLILDRTDQFMFLEVTEMRDSDPRVPKEAPYREYVAGHVYYVVGVVSIFQDYEQDGFGNQLKTQTERKEHVQWNQNVELFVENERGIPISGQVGYNKDRERVFSDYLATIEKHEIAKAAKAKADEARKTSMVQMERLASMRSELKAKRLQLRSEIKAMTLAGANVTDKIIVEKADEILRTETILKSL